MVAAVRTTPGEPAFATALATGQAMSLAQASAYALQDEDHLPPVPGAAGTTTSRRTADGFAPVTPREGEVAMLVAAGLSNREIADTLHVTERTVENHVAHILTRLGFRSRVQIATWATTRRE
jgi:DNA-binding NarL/FixJ family response regulator